MMRNPQDQGEARETEQHRLWFYRPLCFRFVIDPARQVRVTVVDVLKWAGV